MLEDFDIDSQDTIDEINRNDIGLGISVEPMEPPKTIPKINIVETQTKPDFDIKEVTKISPICDTPEENKQKAIQPISSLNLITADKQITPVRITLLIIFRIMFH